MFKSIITACLLGLTATAASANAFHLNPGQPTAISMSTFGPTTIPIGYYEYCQRYVERCQRPAQGSEIQLTRENWNAIVEVNYKVNAAVAPMTDQDIFGVEERWVYPERVGDCEDYALLKRKILNEQMGFPLGALSMTVGMDPNGGGHAVLTVLTDLGDFILDNVEPKVLRWQEAEIQFLKRQSSTDPNVWVSLAPGVKRRSVERYVSSQAN